MQSKLRNIFCSILAVLLVASPSWGADFESAGGISQSDADTLYVNVPGDTMTGDLDLSGAALLTSGVQRLSATGSLDNISSLDATSESTVESAIDTLSNLIDITVTKAGGGSESRI